MLFFSLLAFIVFALTMFLTAGIMFFLFNSGILSPQGNFVGSGVKVLLVVIAIASIGLGVVVSFLIGHIPARMAGRLIRGLNQLAEGKFDTRLPERGMSIGRDVSESFNKLACQLEQSVQSGSDFINNFSHEFKTPIVSILGFAKLLKRGNLTEEQRMEYLDVIEEESGRLSAMATNVLNLTKVEHQEILSDTKEYNLSEQLRRCILMLQGRMEKKHVTPSAAFMEYDIVASEDLLSQVWTNLLDNAVKFSPEGGEVEVGIRPEKRDGGDVLVVEIKNSGAPIPEKDLPFIMNKFYQGDTSHASEGNGIGLAIVSCIVALHGGSVAVTSDESATTFSVTLPRGH
ncbi:MAG: HAMP domain-containing histidine kinase [Clostridiales bacterium]|nr:HAMP domain-containing histidine kinase [Clostridiales bacterium]